MQRSRYGDRRLNANTQMPRRPLGLYNHTLDEGRKAAVEEQMRDAKTALDVHDNQRAALDERVQHAQDVKNEAQGALSAFNQGVQGLSMARNRLETLQQRLLKAQEEEEAFDVTAQRTALQASHPL